MPDAERGGEFLGDPILAPLGMVARDAPDEGDVLAGDAGSADLAPLDLGRQSARKPSRWIRA